MKVCALIIENKIVKYDDLYFDYSYEEGFHTFTFTEYIVFEDGCLVPLVIRFRSEPTADQQRLLLDPYHEFNFSPCETQTLVLVESGEGDDL